MSKCLEGARPRNVVYREYFKDGRRVKEYIIRVEMNINTDEDDPINYYFLDNMLAILWLPALGGGGEKIGLILCQTNNPPTCPSTTPPNGKALAPISNYQGGVAIFSGTDYIMASIQASDTSLDSYSWNNIIAQWVTPMTYGSITYDYIAYVSTSGSKSESDVIRVLFQIVLRPSAMFRQSR